MILKETIEKEFNNLSKGQQKAAMYLLDHPKDFAVKSAGEIGKRIGVSETTVIRFCYSIHLSGYSELQKMVREQLLQTNSTLGQYFTSKVELAEKPQFFANVMEKDLLHIRETIQKICEQDFDRMVNRLIDSEKVYVTGLRSSFSAASWLAFTLGVVRGNTKLIRPDTDDLLLTISDMDESSTFVAISFDRYMKDTIKLAELAKKQGAFVIGITDSSIAPIKEHADLLFHIHSSEKSTIDAAPALFSFLNAVIAGVSIKDRERFAKRREQYEKLDSNHFFIQPGGKLD
ncbi:MurR/RpiR family transcriptional regulator [Bacillus sp. ISL-47]|uniref:MurR/RpiR family transcriptional regulator n=1 Tax=Bacillus sp. ISL-47 TaxID=2819130 RepID=UPI001BEA7ECA|nr:MurR/RpiR family transcriptional regulator [Bacillus sp. ISL-47]MBT2686737.1 MurR/RpiR family transcriptional regulator [Bacillus sp. ISL-47]MBT2706915.1 MurR/RpiR family transcriptional regulator [Pseudomonas sp. ISL-84]